MNAIIAKYPQIALNYFIQIALNNSTNSLLNFLTCSRNNSYIPQLFFYSAPILQLFYYFALSLLNWQSLSKQLKFYFNSAPNIRRLPPYLDFINLEL